MAESISPRMGIHRWTADTDSFARGELDSALANIEARAVVYLEGTRAARPAPGTGGRFYTVKGDTAVLNGLQFYDNGTAWSVVGGNVEDKTVRSSVATTVPLTVRGATSQSAPLQEWRDGTGAVRASISPTGGAALTSLAVSGNTVMGTLTVAGLTVTGAAQLASMAVSGIAPQTITSTALRLDGTPKFNMNANGSFNADGLIPPGTLGFTFAEAAPPGWYLLQGQSLPRSGDPDLFAAVGTRWGALDGASFSLLDTRNRTPIGATITRTPGMVGGAESRALLPEQLPSHTHSMNHDHASFSTGIDGTHNHGTLRNSVEGGTNNVYREGASAGAIAVSSSGEHAHIIDVPAFTGSTGAAGAGSPVDLMQPWFAANAMIKR